MCRIEITAQAQDDADAAYAWIAEHVSTTFAEQWYQELFKQIETLKRHPARCPIAAESSKFTEEIRELVFGKRRHKHKYRILFTTRKRVVTILYIYHSSRQELEPNSGAEE
jgi:plasmid stabilization system protein ParE